MQCANVQITFQGVVNCAAISKEASKIPYSGKFSRGPIFAEGQSSKISRSNFRGWPFQNCSAHNTWLTPPLTPCTRRIKPAEKLVNDRLIEGEMARESHMIEAMVRGYQNSLWTTMALS